jgi:hypothetical protein
MDLMKVACDALAQEQKAFPDFKAGDTITVAYKIKEDSAKGESKERIQKFRGIVIQKRGAGISKTGTGRSGMGLNIMNYRARLSGGELRIDEPPQGGTIVSCIVWPRSQELHDRAA